MSILDTLDPILLKVIQQSSDFFGIADSSGKAVFVNRAGRLIFGLGEDEDISKLTMADFIAPESQEEFAREVVSKSFDSEKVKRVVLVKSFLTDEVFNMEFDFFLIPDAAGGESLFMAFGRDLRASLYDRDLMAAFKGVIENTTDFVGIADR